MTGLEGLLAGRVLGGRYRVEEVIGRGGMGAVYRSLDERLGRQVALKVITLSGAAEAETRDRLRARFQREARSAAALPHHPNVVPVYDYGTDATLGLDYIVMELLRGNDLATRLARSGPPPLAAGLKILYEATRGIAVGHRAGMIHRDVKPGNIFLAEDKDGDVQVRVLDFGIAKLADDEDTASQLTQDGRAPHSPAFASPEQLRGLSQLTPASDVFSLGAVGYQLLLGERPFSEADRNRLSLGMPVPLPSLRQRNPAIPSAVEGIVQRALSYDPVDRFPDAGEMAQALQQAMRELPDTPLEPYATAIPASSPHRSAERVTYSPAEDDDDHTQLMDAASDDRTLLAPPVEPRRPAAATPMASPGAPPPAPPPSVVAPRKRGWGGIVVWSLVLLVLGAAIVAALMQMGGRDTAAVVEPQDTLAVDTLAEDTVAVQTPPTPSPEEEARTLNEEGVSLLNAGSLDEALARFDRARQLDPTTVDYAYNFALTQLRRGDPGSAAFELQRVVERDPGRAGAHFNLGIAHLALNNLDAAEQSLNRARALSNDPREQEAATQQIQRIAQLRGGGVPMDTAPPPPDTGLIRIDTLAAPGGRG